MSDHSPENVLPDPPAQPAAPAPALPTPAQNPELRTQNSGLRTSDPPVRRDFFGEAVREMLLPFANIIENRINPLLAALEQIPDQAQRLADRNFGILDQPHTRPRSFALPMHREPERFLRPPGALAPGQFESVCCRSGNCVAACPANAILLDPHGLVADGFPYIVAQTQSCVVCESLACMKSCPSGALKLVDRVEINMGT